MAAPATTSSPQHHPQPLPRPAKLLVGGLGWYAALGGITSLLGWAADLPRLTDWNADGISIQPNATVAVMVSGLALDRSQAQGSVAPGPGEDHTDRPWA
jgi:hypothetical protein